MSTPISRRSAMKKLAGTSAAVTVAASLPARVEAVEAASPVHLKGNIHHSVSAWCYNSLFNPGKNRPAKMSFEDFCRECRGLGIESVELLGPREWPTVKKVGLTCAMCNGPDGINYGWNRVQHHDDLLAKFERAIPEVAQSGFPNIITFSGVRRGKDNWGEYVLDDEEGLKNCVAGLKRLVPIAEKHQINVVLELLNSKVNHPEYMADHTAWGVAVCRQVGSDRLKLLYDIYHMQIMEGDLIRTIRDNQAFIAHYHTGGNPGRNEIEETQEINFPAVMRAIVATGFKGFVGQEFVPKHDPLTSLKEAIQICDV